MITESEQRNWQEQLHALLRYIDIVEQREPEHETPRIKTIRAAITQLKRVGKELFYFFLYGYQGNYGYALESSDDLTPSSAFSRIIDQISNDLTVFQLAMEQRIISAGKENEERRDIILTLNIADKLAASVHSSIKKFLDKKTTVLTYLHKSPNVRVLPYTPIALIGIPATSIRAVGHASQSDQDISYTSDARDLLAIPHEFGHHLYWYGRQPAEPPFPARVFLRDLFHKEVIQATLTEKNRGSEAWAYQWSEEIFADIVGCIVGGPVFALSFQDLQLTKSNSALTEDNGTHPVPMLRPYIFLEVLRQMNISENAVVQLEKRWVQQLKQRNIEGLDVANFSAETLANVRQQLQFHPFGQPDVTIDEPLDVLSSIVEKAVILLKRDMNTAVDVIWSTAADVASDDAAENAEWLHNLYHNFMVDKVTPLLDSASTLTSAVDHLDEPVLDDITQKSAMQIARDLRLFKQNEDVVSGEQLDRLDTLLGSAPDSFPPETPLPFTVTNWKALLDFGGWTTEGPGPKQIGG